MNLLFLNIPFTRKQLRKYNKYFQLLSNVKQKISKQLLFIKKNQRLPIKKDDKKIMEIEKYYYFLIKWKLKNNYLPFRMKKREK